jgi:D-sedoheptulose 7-phosphate isomerase
VRAVEAARAGRLRTLALTARDGGAIKDLVDLCLIVPTQRTDRAQEIHLALQHAICDVIDSEAAS